jgi:hypothetical protein
VPYAPVFGSARRRTSQVLDRRHARCCTYLLYAGAGCRCLITSPAGPPRTAFVRLTLMAKPNHKFQELSEPAEDFAPVPRVLEHDVLDHRRQNEREPPVGGDHRAHTSARRASSTITPGSCGMPSRLAIAAAVEVRREADEGARIRDRRSVAGSWCEIRASRATRVTRDVVTLRNQSR